MQRHKIYAGDPAYTEVQWRFIFIKTGGSKLTKRILRAEKRSDICHYCLSPKMRNVSGIYTALAPANRFGQIAGPNINRVFGPYLAESWSAG